MAGAVSARDASVTPVRRQYLDLKARHPGAILFFRLGDFYETFDDDAETCARLLQITLTGREMGRGQRVPMAGVPAHAVQGYLAKLVAQGRTVAVCEQVDDARVGSSGRTMMAREVTRVVTPGTVVEPAMLDGRRNNYLVAIIAKEVRSPDRTVPSRARNSPMPATAETCLAWGLAYADVSTGEFRCTQLDGPDGDAEVRREIARIDPSECVIPRSSNGPGESTADVEASAEALACDGRVKTPWDEWRFDARTASDALRRRFGVATLSGYGLDELPLAMQAAGALVSYLDRTHVANAPALDGIATYSTGSYLRLDPFTRRNLEIDVPPRGAGPSLLGTIDETRTPGGARLLRRWLGQPLSDTRAINARHDAVASLVGDGGRRGTVRKHLGSIADIERISNRVAQGGATPRELHALRHSLTTANEIAAVLRREATDAGAMLADAIDACQEVQALIERAIPPEVADESQRSEAGGERTQRSGTHSKPGAPVGRDAVVARGAGDPLATEPLIRRGFSVELDGLVAGVQEARRWITRLEGVERERTGITGLKVGYNRVFGYYIHVPARSVDRVPDDYVRRQTIADGERYVTPDLKAHEDIVVEAAGAIEKSERAVYDGVLSEIATHGIRLRVTARALAQIDVIAGLAEVAVRRGYVRPEIDDAPGLDIHDGRHPIVEANLDPHRGEAFVPNDCSIDADSHWAMILTGPNMAGKSTYLRSIALIVLMAQAGSFVPASRARIGVVDRLFTRVGAHDELAAGRSTFMVEMVEAAQILRHATRRSLVILDEIGRGTSTHDGLAIAQSVVEYLHHRHLDTADGGGRPRTLFATHYHELAALEETLPGVVNARLDVLEEGSRVTFLHRVVPGAAGRSYGIHVARLAGMPRAVTDRAALLLDALEVRATLSRGTGSTLPIETDEASSDLSHGERGRPGRRVSGTTTREGAMQLTLFAPPTHPVAEALLAIDVDDLTPREALNTLARLQALADSG